MLMSGVLVPALVLVTVCMVFVHMTAIRMAAIHVVSRLMTRVSMVVTAAPITAAR